MKKVYSKSYRANGSTNIDENREFQSLKATGAYYARAESQNIDILESTREHLSKQANEQ